MTAFTICSYFNIDTSDYSLSYLDHYTKNTDIKEKKNLLNEIKETSKEFIEVIEDSLSKDIDITKNIDLEPPTSISTSESNTQSIADVVTNTEPKTYVKFLWSENNVIEDDSIYTFEDANELLSTLTKLNTANRENSPNEYIGYDKTKFELHFNKECTDKFYTGRFDIGDGFASDLKEHIFKSVHSMFPNVKSTTKQIKLLFEHLDINPNDYSRTKSKNIEHTL